MGSNATDAPRSWEHPTVLLEVRRSNRVKLLCRVGKQEKALRPRRRLLPHHSLKRTRSYVSAPWRGFPAAPLSSGVGRLNGKPFSSIGRKGIGFAAALALGSFSSFFAPHRSTRMPGFTGNFLWRQPYELR